MMNTASLKLGMTKPALSSHAPRFQGVQLVMDTQSKAALATYEKQAEVIRKRIRGDLEVMGYDQKVNDAIKQELGPGPNYQQMKDAVEQKSKAFAEQKRQENAQDPSYQGLLFDHGFYPNPLNPESKSQQMLYVDGADVQRFKQAVTDELFSPMRDLGFYGENRTSVRRVDFRSLNGVDSISRSLVKEWAADCVTQYQAGQTDKILDLDA